MFGRTQKDEDHAKLEPVMTRILLEMEQFGPDSPEYPALLGHLERIVALRASKEKRRLTPDTVFLGFVNFAGILTIVAYEHAHVITSKATSFVMKPK